MDEVPRDRDVVVVCRVGARSAQVVAYLRANGWDRVANLAGGMYAWQAAGRPMRRRGRARGAGAVSPGPLVFAHRGSSADLPEHTLDAYRRAIDEGADGLECDVRLTRDGHVVCIHDRRLDRTSNGRGLVSRATLAELERLDFTSWRTRHLAPQANAARRRRAC